MAQSREYEAQKRKYAQDHWTEELAQKEKLKGEVIKGNDIVTKLKWYGHIVLIGSYWDILQIFVFKNNKI